jgi:GAF domain-containing protein
VDTEKLAEVFVELADTLVDDFDVIDLLHALCTRSVELLDASAAGLLLTDNGDELRLVVSSSDRAQLLDLFQLQSDEGPCMDAYRSGEPVMAQGSDQAHTRWPRFGPTATTAGFTSIVALPMRLRGQVIGALNLFGTAETPPVREEHLRIAQAMADAATIAILQERLSRSRRILNEQLQVALNSRIVIEQAKGVLSTRLDISTQEAFGLLRARARHSRRRLVDVAEEAAEGQWRTYALEEPYHSSP